MRPVSRYCTLELIHTPPNVILNARINPQFTWHRAAPAVARVWVNGDVRRRRTESPQTLQLRVRPAQIGEGPRFIDSSSSSDVQVFFMQRATTNAREARGRQVKLNEN